MINKQDIKEFLSKIGVKSNGTVLVHSSIRSIGGIEGGIDALIDAFTEYLTEVLRIYIHLDCRNAVKSAF